MKKNLMLIAALSLGLATGLSSCSDDKNGEIEFEKAAILDCTASNQMKWGAYMQAVANRLNNDAQTLYNDWTVSFNGGESYANVFKNHRSGGFLSAGDAGGGLPHLHHQLGGRPGLYPALASALRLLRS